MNYMVMDSMYCTMGRWISVIVGEAMGMTLYEGSDLCALSEEEWLTPEYLAHLDERLATMSDAQAREDEDLQRVHQALTKAIEKAIAKGPCIIHERAAGDILEGKVKCLKVLLYNTSMEHRLPRAVADKTYDLEALSHDDLVAFVQRIDHQRSVYRNGVSPHLWGEKESYDICLDSDVLSREKCAEILIEALKEVSLDLDQCASIIKESFTWTK